MRWALENDKALEVAGQGTKRAIGRPSQTDITLDLSGLTGVTLYEPEELVLSARAGTPLAEIEELLDKNNQELGFEPMDYGPLFGQPAGGGTIGGTIAANLSGPRRIKAGAARDHFLGVTGVTGRAETIKSGGRVVKNVTGYDMCKVLAGSWGTLAAMTDVTLKSTAQGRDAGDRHRQRPRRRASRARHGGSLGFVLGCLGRSASARSRGVMVRRAAEAGSQHHSAPGGLRALGRAPQGGAGRADEAVRTGRRCSTKRIRSRFGAACGR